MSAEATGYVFRASPYSGATFAVHLAIADSVNDQHQNRFWMSVESLAIKARVSERQAQYSLRELVAGGHLKRLDEGNGGRAKPAEYLFVLYETVQGLHPSSDERVQAPSLKGADDRLKGEQVAPEPKKTPRKATQGKNSPSFFAAFWVAYPRKKGKGAAERAFTKATSRADPETIISSAERFASWCESGGIESPRFIPYPTTWLNQERWTDELEDPVLMQPRRNGKTTASEGFADLHRRLNETRGVGTHRNGALLGLPSGQRHG